jgi:hypothetical protein
MGHRVLNGFGWLNENLKKHEMNSKISWNRNINNTNDSIVVVGVREIGHLIFTYG